MAEFRIENYPKARWALRWVGLVKTPRRDADGACRARYRWWLTFRGANYLSVLAGPIRLTIPRPWSLRRVFHDGWSHGMDQARSWTDEERTLKLGRNPGPKYYSPANDSNGAGDSL